jgi:hypothetical protein
MGNAGSSGGGGGGGGVVEIHTSLDEVDTSGIDVSGGQSNPNSGIPDGENGKVIVSRIPPPKATLLVPENGAQILNEDRAVLAWENAPGAENYRVEVWIASGGDWVLTDNVVLSENSLEIEVVDGSYRWRVTTMNTAGENVGDFWYFTADLAPEIVEISVDENLIDRRADTGGAVHRTTIKILVSARFDRENVALDNVRVWIRDAKGGVVVENQCAQGFDFVSDNLRLFSFVFDPPDSLPDSALGWFDVKVSCTDNFGFSVTEDWDGKGNDLFLVDDLEVRVSIADNTPVWQLEVSGNALRVYNAGLTDLDNAVVVDNNVGDIWADFGDNHFSVTYSLVSPVRLRRGDEGQIQVWVRDGALDGISPVLTYRVEGDNLDLLNFFVSREDDKTIVTFDARWLSDGSTAVSGTVYLSENSEIVGSISGGAGSITIPHSAAVSSGYRTLSVFDNANRPIWRVRSQTFYFNILPVATELRADNLRLPAKVTPTPTFAWVFEDNNPNDSQYGVRIQVGSTPDNNDLWDWIGAGYTLGEKIYEGAGLERGRTYYVRVIVQDSRNEWQNEDNSDRWTRGVFAVNQLPQVHQLLVEGENNPTELETKNPVFSWWFSDADSDEQVKYQVRVGTSPGSGDVWTHEGVGSENSLRYQGPELSPGTTYYVSVRVFDGLEWSGWAAAHFSLKAEASEGSEEVQTGASGGAAEASPVLDLEPPVLELALPEVLCSSTFSFEISVVDNSEIDLTSISVMLDNTPVDFWWREGAVVVQLSELLEGPHSLAISVSDVHGNAAVALAHFYVDLPTVEFVGPDAVGETELYFSEGPVTKITLFVEVAGAPGLVAVAENKGLSAIDGLEVYRVFEVSLSGVVSRGGEIEFSVEREWIRARGHPEDVRLFKLNAGGAVELPTEVIGRDNRTIRYRASVSSFSTFAIGLMSRAPSFRLLIGEFLEIRDGAAWLDVLVNNPLNRKIERTLVLEMGRFRVHFSISAEPGENAVKRVYLHIPEVQEGEAEVVLVDPAGTVLDSKRVVLLSPASAGDFTGLGVLAAGIPAAALVYSLVRRRRVAQRTIKIIRAPSARVKKSAMIDEYYELLVPLAQKLKRKERRRPGGAACSST